MPQGQYIGEADDPRFVDPSRQICTDTSSTTNTSDPQQTWTDTSSTTNTSDKGNTGGTGDAGGSGGGGDCFPVYNDEGELVPKGDDSPADDGSGGGTPRSNNYLPADDSSGGGTNYSPLSKIWVYLAP